MARGAVAAAAAKSKTASSPEKSAKVSAASAGKSKARGGVGVGGGGAAAAPPLPDPWAKLVSPFGGGLSPEDEWNIVLKGAPPMGGGRAIRAPDVAVAGPDLTVRAAGDCLHLTHACTLALCAGSCCAWCTRVHAC